MKPSTEVSAVLLAVAAGICSGAVEPAGYTLVLGKADARATLRTFWSDGTEVAHAITVGSERQRGFNLPEASFEFSGFHHFFCDNRPGRSNPARYHVRPNIARYGTSSTLKPEGVALTNAWDSLPSAVGHDLRVDIVPTRDGRAGLWLDGSWMVDLAPANPSDAVLTNVTLTGGADVRIESVTPLFDAVDTDRFTPLDLARVPRPGSFADVKERPKWRLREDVPWKVASPSRSSDVGVIKCVQGKWALECEEYYARTPADAYPYGIHFRVPTALYRKAHLVFALEPATNRIPLVNLRLAHYLFDGSGPNMFSDTTLDWRNGIPSDVKRLGAIAVGTNRIDVYTVSVPLKATDVIEAGSRLPYVDFDILGPMANGNRSSRPDARLKSAFHFLAVTLEKESVNFDEVVDPTHPGNIWTQDEKGKKLGFVIGSQRKGARVTVDWSCVDHEGGKWMSGSRDLAFDAVGERKTETIDCAKIDKPGLYTFPIRVRRGQEILFETEMRLAVVPPAGRVVGKCDSPYCTWMWTGQHGTPARWEDHLIPIQKAGIRKVSYCPLTKDYAEKYDVTSHGGVMAPHISNFDAKTGRFKPVGNVDGETWFVGTMKAAIAKAQHASFVTIWHENAPRGGLPPELIGEKSPEPGEAERRFGGYVNECGRIIRKHFPSLRIQIGNSSSSWGAGQAPIRGGAKGEYYDAIGNEATCQTFAPECLAEGAPQGVFVATDVASRLTGRRIKADGMWEYSSRTDVSLGERMQAAFYMRDILVGLANEYTLVSIAGVYDCRSTYYNTMWGSADLLRRAPYGHAKLAYVAYAALTKALDGVTFVRQLDTGSSTVYAVLFRRTDGRYATACWCARGEAELAFDVGGKAEGMDMYGRVTALGGLIPFARKRSVCSELPSYVITDKPVKEAKIVARTFTHGADLAAGGTVLGSFGSLAAVTNVPHPRLKSEHRHWMPIRVPADVILSEATDPERGKSLEVKLDCSKNAGLSNYHTEYATIRLKKAIPVPGEPSALGVWVKGNSNGGKIRFEIVDARGAVFANYHPHYFDWPGVQSVNFDGWALVTASLDPQSLHWDERLGLAGCTLGFSGTWMNVSGPGGDGRIVYPIKILAVSVDMNRQKFGLRGFEPAEPSICLGEILSIGK